MCVNWQECFNSLYHQSRQAANLLAHRLATLGLAEMLAVGAGPQQAHRLAVSHSHRGYFKHITAKVARLRVIGDSACCLACSSSHA